MSNDVHVAFKMLGLTTCVILFTEAVCTVVSLQLRGVTLPMFLFLGQVIWSGLILMMVHRFVGSLVLKILSRGTTKRFWSVVNCAPLRLEKQSVFGGAGESGGDYS